MQHSSTTAHWFGTWPSRHKASPGAHQARHERVPPPLREIARQSAPDALARLDTSGAGLTAEEAERRYAEYGPNTVAHERRHNLALQILERLATPLNVLLLVLASASIAVGNNEAGYIILSMVVLSVSLAFIQERRSSRAADALTAMVHTTATVLRRTAASASTAQQATSPSATAEIPLHLLVPGDIVHLSAGDMIPGDLRLISAKDLFVNQASFTGEALPVEKHADAEPVSSEDSLELRNVCFMGTTVVSGTAMGVIVLTGARAYFGQLADLIAGDRAPTDFDRGIARFTWMMISFIAVMAPLVFLINGLTKRNWLEALLFAMAVAVGLTPEMLPMIVTVNLAKGAIAMARKRVIVKRLHSIQNFGAMDVLCTDKTGTLTMDRVILEKHVDLFGKESAQVLEYAYLNSCYQSGLKNLLDVAVLEHADRELLQVQARDFRKLDEVPFDFERRRMSVAVEGRGQRLLICKGAVEEVYAVSRRGRAGEETFDLDATHRALLGRTSAELNEDGFRVIALAYKELPGTQSVCSVADEADLTLIGYIAFLDPPKDSARQAIAALAQHGVSVKILTGDNDVVTRKICHDVGLPVERVVLGHEIESLSPADLATLAVQASVFAKLSPIQKASVIDALHRSGHVVGFLGDGINDGPALKAADVGVSVDSAVDVAKEAADIILLEKNLLVLDEGVIEGRKVFGNVVKYIRMGASSNFGNMASVIGASAWLPFLPMAPVQVLTNNLLYDFSQSAIPTDDVDPEYLEKPRRWEIGNIFRFVVLIGPVSSLFDYATYFTMYYLFAANTPAQASVFQTGWFVESLVSQTLIIHVIRTGRVPFIESRASAPLAMTTLAICGIGLWLPFSPLARALGFTPPPPLYWPVLAVLLVGYLALTYLAKRWLHRRFGLE